MNKLIALIIFLGLSGCVSPYSHLSQPYFPATNKDATVPVFYLKPVIEENKVHPVKELIVKAVEKDSPAEKSGLLAGDKILTINEKSFATVEQLREYLGKARWLENTYRIVRSGGRVNLEKEITVKPEANFFYSGVLYKYLDGEGKVSYPRYSYDYVLYQSGERFSVATSMSHQGSLLVLEFEVSNTSGTDLFFDKYQILLLDAQKSVIPILPESKVAVQQYSDAMVLNPMAAMQFAPTLMNAQNGKNDEAPIRVPSETNRTDKVYAMGDKGKRPIAVKIKIENETFEFKFG